MTGKELLKEQYIRELKLHDWYYNYSDDHRVWVKGKDQRVTIDNLQKQVDPDYFIWNEFAPEDFKVYKTW